MPGLRVISAGGSLSRVVAGLADGLACAEVERWGQPVVVAPPPPAPPLTFRGDAVAGRSTGGGTTSGCSSTGGDARAENSTDDTRLPVSSDPVPSVPATPDEAVTVSSGGATPPPLPPLMPPPLPPTPPLPPMPLPLPPIPPTLPPLPLPTAAARTVSS